jgi:hypothetical protein
MNNRVIMPTVQQYHQTKYLPDNFGNYLELS